MAHLQACFGFEAVRIVAASSRLFKIHSPFVHGTNAFLQERHNFVSFQIKLEMSSKSEKAGACATLRLFNFKSFDSPEGEKRIPNTSK